MKARIRHSLAGGTSDEYPCSKWGPMRSTYQQRRIAAHSQRIRSCQVMSHVCTPGANLQPRLALLTATRVVWNWKGLLNFLSNFEFLKGHILIAQGRSLSINGKFGCCPMTLRWSYRSGWLVRSFPVASNFGLKDTRFRQEHHYCSRPNNLILHTRLCVCFDSSRIHFICCTNAKRHESR